MLSSEPTAPHLLEPRAPGASGKAAIELRSPTALATRAPVTTTLAGWGQLHHPGRELLGEDLERLTRGAVLTRGLGRSYGDSSLPPDATPVVAGSALADRILHFDAESGLLRAEAGLSLFTINQLFLPRNWFLPVTPGTQFVTLGGAVASDVHGKGHHIDGCFGEHVTSLKVRLANDEIVECGPELERDLFRATIGGMGLTGHILEVEFRMKRIPSPWIWEESERVPNIDVYIERLKTAAKEWPFTVGWIDCVSRGRSMGRGILMKGRWAEPSEVGNRRFKPIGRRFSVPFSCPNWLINPLTVGIFNAVNYHKHFASVQRHLIHPQTFWYPLDIAEHWYRLYGRRGFTQYQCVLPTAERQDGARRFLEILTRQGTATPLCVIKDCGPEGTGVLSFPKAGISIAVDLPVGRNTQRDIDELNEFVIKEGGRIYLSKDAFTRPEHFRAMEPRLPEFERLRRKYDPELRLRSAQSVRLFGDPT